MRTSAALGTVVFGSLLAIACGSEADPNLFPDGTSRNGASSGANGSSGGILGGGGGGSGGEFAECASNVADGQLRPVHMVLAVDISGSMCEINDNSNNTDCNNPASKWGQTKKALSDFFASPESRDMYVSVIPWSGQSCNGFDTPVTPEVGLPATGGALSRAVARLNPNGGTPTHGAIQGAQKYATSVQSSIKDNGKVIIALATDGMPTGCSTLPQAQTAATASNAAGFPVYVIGVGNQAANLKSLAQAGGTNDAFNVSSATASADLLKALQTIRGNALTCSLSMPSPPAGQTLDLSKVNVVFDTTASNTVPYSQDCSNADGWRYTPSAAAPTGIELCTKACDNVRANAAGKLKLVLGCATKSGPTK